MLVTGIVVGFLAGFLLGGSISNFVTNSRRLRWLGLLALGAIVRFGTEIALNAGVPGSWPMRLPLFAFAFALLLAGCWGNRSVVGFGLLLAGTFANLIPILLNSGSMPIWAPALTAAGFTQADVHSAFHTIIYDTPGPGFLLRGGPLGDIIPVPLPDHPERHLGRRPDPCRGPGLVRVRRRPAPPDEPGDNHVEEALLRRGGPRRWPGSPTSAGLEGRLACHARWRRPSEAAPSRPRRG